MQQPIITVENLCCKSGRRHLLKDINWTVNAGEHWLIFGMNGCGKTTLLSCIAGFKPITSGTITVLGKQYDKENIFSLRKKVGWVSSSFFDHYYRNELPLQIVLSGLFGTFGTDGIVCSKEVRLAKALLREFHVGDKMKQPFCTMSKGERQNVLIARALISKPEILVLDEPGTGLDIYAREQLMAMIRLLAEHGNFTILYVTHYPEEIQSFMNKTMLLQTGTVFAQGDTEKILREELLTQFFHRNVQFHRFTGGRLRMTLETGSDILRIYEESG